MPESKWKAGRYRVIGEGQQLVTVNGTDILEVYIRPNEGLDGQEVFDEAYPRKISIWFDDRVEPTVRYLAEKKLVTSPFVDQWDFTGKEFEVVCKYNAKGYDAWYFPRTGGAPAADPDAANRINKKFGTLFKKTFPLHGVKTVDDLPKGPQDDNIPF